MITVGKAHAAVSSPLLLFFAKTALMGMLAILHWPGVGRNIQPWHNAPWQKSRLLRIGDRPVLRRVVLLP